MEPTRSSKIFKHDDAIQKVPSIPRTKNYILRDESKINNNM